MPTDGSGVYALPSGYTAVTGQPILASQHNPPLEDIRDGLTARLMRNGSNAMTADLPLGGNKVTGLGNGTATTDAAAFGQVGRVYLGEQSVSAAAQIDFTGANFFSSAYRAYEFHLQNLTTSAADSIIMRVSIDGGATFPSGAADYTYGWVYADAAAYTPAGTGSGGTTSIVLGSCFTNSSEPLAGWVTLFNPNSLTHYKEASFDTVGVNAVGTQRLVRGKGRIIFAGSVANDIDGVRFRCNGAATLTGKIAMYGVR